MKHVAALVGMVLVLVTGAAYADSASELHVTVAATAHIAPTPDACLFSNHEDGTIRSDQLGNGAWSDVEAVNFCSVANGVSVGAQFILTAANGDKIFAAAETSGTFDATGNLHINGTFHVTGGTGRYAGARGLGAIRGQAAPPDATGSAPLTATLDALLIVH